MRLLSNYLALGALGALVWACSNNNQVSSSNNNNPDGGGGSQGDATTADPSSPDGGPLSLTRATHFAEAGRDWTVPAGTPSDYLTFLDVNGDGWLDGLHTWTDDEHAFGTSDADAYWKLFLNNGTSFPTSFASYSVPSLTLRSPGVKEYADGSSPTLTRFEVVQDFDGDRAVDHLDVIAGKLHKGSATGFGSSQPFDVSSIPNSGFSYFQDVDGDKIGDIIISAAGLTALTDAQGAFLKIARTTATGFGPLQTWRIQGTPPPIDIGFTFGDFDGDGKADLYDASLAKDGGGIRVWRNNGSGFDSPTSFTVPTACYCFPNAARGYELLDLDGDGRLDLVEPADYKSLDAKQTVYLRVWGADSGKPYWKFYPNDGHGTFASTAVEWHVPVRDGDAQEGYNGVTDPHSSGGLDPSFFTIDFNGDGHLDLIHFAKDASGLTVYFGAP